MADHSLLLHFVLLTDAAAVLVLYCRFLKKNLNPPGCSGLDVIIGCKDKRAPMVVTLGQQYHVMSGHVFPWHNSMTITKLRSDAIGPGCH